MASVTCGPGHVLAVLKMVRADLLRVVQLLCSFQANITWPSVYDPFIGPVKNNDEAAREEVV